MTFLLQLICRAGGHNLSPATGAFAAECTFCGGQFEEFHDQHGATTLPHRGEASKGSGNAMNTYESDDEAQVGAVN